MANKRICVQLDFNGPSPIVVNANGTFDKRLSMINMSRLLRGMSAGALGRPTLVQSTVVVQQSVVQATGTITPSGVLAADTASIGGQALTATQLRASGTATMASVQAADTLVVNGVSFAAVNGAVTPGQATWDISGTDTQDAASFVTQLAAYRDPRLDGIVASKSAAGVVTIYAVEEGTIGNAVTLSSASGGRITLSGATLANGAAPANNQFDYIGTNITTGTSLKNAINRSTTAAVKQVSATVAPATGVVTITAKPPGVAGNAIALVSSNGARLAVSGSGTMTGGSAGAPISWPF